MRSSDDRLHLLFERACQVDIQLQDIRVSHKTGVAAVARQLAIGPGGLHHGRCRTSRRGSDEHAAKCVSHRRRQVLVDESPVRWPPCPARSTRLGHSLK